MDETALAAPTEALAGLLERVTYRDAEIGFRVLHAKARGSVIWSRALNGATEHAEA